MTARIVALLLVLGVTIAPVARAADAGGPSSSQAYALRLHPGDDLKQSLQAFAKAHQLKAAYVATCVGSLRAAKLRLADQQDATAFSRKFEMVSLVGTLSDDSVHLHLAIADSQGHTFGGHLVDGCTIYTTAEIVLGELTGLRFTRPVDPASTFHELSIGPR